MNNRVRFFMIFFLGFLNKVIGILSSLIFSSIVFCGGIDAQAQELIIGFGDSITAGVPYIDGYDGNGRRVGGYEPTLEDMMNNAGRPAFVYNYGVGGETTPNGVNRIDSVLSQRASDIILIMEGTNDQWFGVSAQTTAFNIGVMIDKSRVKQTIPIVGTLTPASRDIRKDIPKKYNPAIVTVVRNKGVQLVDHYSAIINNWDNLEYDDVHPNWNGYKAIAQDWFNALVAEDESCEGCLIPPILLLLSD